MQPENSFWNSFRKMAKKDENKATEFIENPEALQEQLDKTSDFAQQNREIILGVIVGILAVVGGAFWYSTYQEDNENEAQQELFPAVFYFEKDSLGKALQGDGDNTTIGLEAVADEYSGTKAGNLANVYIGVAKLKEGQFDQAIDILSNFSADDYLLQSRVHSLIGDAYMEKEQYGDAISYYQKAVGRYENEQFTPIYLRKLALAQELSGDTQGATTSYQKIADDFKESNEFVYAKKMLTKLGK